MAQLPRLRVKLVDGTEFDVVTNVADLAQWERYAAKHNMDSTGFPVNMMLFQSWRAALKSGACPGDVTMEQFADRLDGLPQIAEEEPVDPTRQAPGDD